MDRILKVPKFCHKSKFTYFCPFRLSSIAALILASLLNSVFLTRIAIPASSKDLAFLKLAHFWKCDFWKYLCWSPKIGITTIGTPALDASNRPFWPPCPINKAVFPESKREHKLRKNSKILLIKSFWGRNFRNATLLKFCAENSSSLSYFQTNNVSGNCKNADNKEFLICKGMNIEGNTVPNETTTIRFHFEIKFK